MADKQPPRRDGLGTSAPSCAPSVPTILEDIAAVLEEQHDVQPLSPERQATAALEARVAALEALIRDVEWVDGSGDTPGWCSVCEHVQTATGAHYANCRLDAALTPPPNAAATPEEGS